MLQRKFQTYFRMPGEAQKIERLMEVFGQRYCQCNPAMLQRLQNPDTVFVLSFAVIMLNTDLHTPSIKGNRHQPKITSITLNLRQFFNSYTKISFNFNSTKF